MKLCLYQGTFNPIHNAHLEVAKYVLKNFDFDKILFIPAYKPPHKECLMATKELALHRLKMVELGIKGIKGFDVSDIEFEREVPSYTYYTIEELYKRYNIKGKIKFIIGTDAFKYIESWHKADELKVLLDFILFYRDDEYDSMCFEQIKNHGFNFELAKLPFLDISSSSIRKMVMHNESIYDIVPFDVAKYIEDNELYKQKC